MIELDQVLHRHWPEYERRFGSNIPASHRKAVKAILRCRTPALGGHHYRCNSCGVNHFVYHSCNNRACAKCGQAEADYWIEKQKARLLPAHYFLVTFTVPEQLRKVIRSNQKKLYSLMFAESAGTLQDVAANPKHLGATLGFFGVFHSWTRDLAYHPHIHYVVPGGGLTEDGLKWKNVKSKEFFLPEKVLAQRFKNRFRAALMKTGLPLLRQIPPGVWKMNWVVDCLPVGGGEAVLKYLANYVYKTALGSQRILRDENGKITFTVRRSDTKKTELMTVDSMEFIRRFLQHTLPEKFQRVRSFGWMASAAKKRWEQIHALLDWKTKPKPAKPPSPEVTCRKCEMPLIYMGQIQKVPP